MVPSVLDLLFPRRSLTGEIGSWMTEEERRQLIPKPIVQYQEQLRSRELSFIDQITASMYYERSPLLQRAIHTFKYRRVPGLVDTLADLIVQVTSDFDPQAVLCPVPLHWLRQFQRGFNQSELLAQKISEQKNIPVCSLLKRSRTTGHQARRNREDRLCAVQNAFVCTASNVPSHVILIDDLATTGATLDACASTLKDAGVTRVEAWVIAQG